MNQTVTREPGESPNNIFIFAFSWWIFIFISFLLPLDLLYRMKALLLSLPFWLILVSFSTIVLLFTLIALIIASLSFAFSRAIQIFSAKGSSIIRNINIIIGIFFMMSIFVYYFKEWIKITFNLITQPDFFNIRYGIFYFFMIALLIVMILFYNKLSFIKRLSSAASTAFRINLWVIAICTFLVAGVVGHSFYNNYHTDSLKRPIAKSPSSSPLPNIIIINFDAMAARHSSLYGYSRDTTPNLVALGRESYVFNNMISSCNHTSPSLSSLMNGKYVATTHFTGNYSYLFGKDARETLPKVLQGLGYQTMTSAIRSIIVNLQGFDKIDVQTNNRSSLNLTASNLFRHWGLGPLTWFNDMIDSMVIVNKVTNYTDKILASLHRLSGHPKKTNWLGVKAPESMLNHGLELINEAKTPFFLWIHLMPPHDPYVPRSDFLYSFLDEKIFDAPEKFYKDISPFITISQSRYQLKDQPSVDKLARRYDEFIRYADHEMGNFIAALRQNGILDKSILIVTSDHGEMFEKGFWGHAGPYLYQCLINVPFILRMPGQTQGYRINANVGFPDVAPSILDLLGTEAPAWMDGKSFKKAMQDPAYDDQATKYSMHLGFMNDPADFHTRSMAAIKGNYKLIHYLDLKQFEMFNLRQDPAEQHNLVEKEPEKFLMLKKELDKVRPQ